MPGGDSGGARATPEQGSGSSARSLGTAGTGWKTVKCSPLLTSAKARGTLPQAPRPGALRRHCPGTSSCTHGPCSARGFLGAARPPPLSPSPLKSQEPTWSQESGSHSTGKYLSVGFRTTSDQGEAQEQSGQGGSRGEGVPPLTSCTSVPGLSDMALSSTEQET